MNGNAAVLATAINLLALWAFVFVFWRDYRIDAFRDHVFSIRDRLFQYAADGGVPFDHPAYTMLRYRMNVILRYGHVFTLWRLFMVLKHPAPGNTRDAEMWLKALNTLPRESRETLLESSRTLTVAILQLMAYRSFILYVVFRPFMPTNHIESVVRRNPRVVSTVEKVESEALEEDALKHGRDSELTVVA